jgi:hypothetical protein
MDDKQKSCNSAERVAFPLNVIRDRISFTIIYFRSTVLVKNADSINNVVEEQDQI